MSSRPLLAALGLVGALSAGGCVENDISLSITRFIPADRAASMSGQCLYDPMAIVSSTSGLYDIALGKLFNTGYDVAFVVRNNLITLPNTSVETQAYYLRSFNVTLDVTGPAQAFLSGVEAREFGVPTGTIRLAPGEVAANIATVIKAGALDGLVDIATTERSSIIANIAPVATRAEEQQIGAASSFPIDICNGCLTDKSFPFCSTLTVKMALPGNGCNPAADAPVTCCTTGSAADPGPVVCGANVPLPTGT